MHLVVEPIIKRNKIQNSPSAYQPGELVKARLAEIRKQYITADTIRNQSYEEFNFRNLDQYMNDSQRAFNSFIPAPSPNPDEAWKANTVRPITRNKVISIAAHVTAAILYPSVIAQNSNDEEDKASALVMKDLMEWSNEQSNYAKDFVYAVIAALVNPATIIYEGFAEIKRKIKEIQENGSWTMKEVIDEVWSGFQNLIVPCDELYIGNAYEHEIQKQPFLIWRRVIDYSAAQVKYGENENFKKYVRPGLRIFCVDDQSLFYDAYDEELRESLVEEVVYYNRLADLELRIVNGVLMDDPDRPIQRNDKMYPFVKSGYELIDEGRFFYYKSLVDKLRPDQNVIDTLYNMVIDGTFLQLMPPSVVYGDEEITSGVFIPGAVNTMREGSKLETLQTGNNLNAGFNTLQKVEDSLSESSQDPSQSGQATKGSQTAFEVAKLEQNAKTVLGLFGKMVGFMVEEFGSLRMNTILQHMTVGEALEVQGSGSRLKFRSFLLPDREVDGKKVSKKIEFTMEMPETQEGAEEESFAMMEEEELVKDKKRLNMRLVKVNPELFRSLKFKVKINPDFMQTSSDAVRKALNLEAYDRAIQNQMVDQEAVTRDFLLANYKPGEEEKYIKKAQALGEPMPNQPALNMAV